MTSVANIIEITAQKLNELQKSKNSAPNNFNIDYITDYILLKKVN